MTEQEFKHYFYKGKTTSPETMKDLLCIADFVKGFFDLSKAGSKISAKAGFLIALTVAYEYGKTKALKE